MDEAFMIKLMLLSIFFFGGALLILLGILLWRRLWDGGSVEVEAECIDVQTQTAVLGSSLDRTYFPHAKRPVYLYYYEGRRYTASPLLSSNRPGYDPVLGRCSIRINPKKPEKVYSPERKFVAQILIFVGAIYMVIAALLAVILPG